MSNTKQQDAQNPRTPENEDEDQQHQQEQGDPNADPAQRPDKKRSNEYS